MGEAPTRFLGWSIQPPAGVLEPAFVPYQGRPLLITGPNGTGKSTLLRSMTGEIGASAEVYSGVPARFLKHLALYRARVEGGAALPGSPKVLRLDAHDLEGLEGTAMSREDIKWLEIADLESDSFTLAGGGLIQWGTSESQRDVKVVLDVGDPHVRQLRHRWVSPEPVGAMDAAAQTAEAFKKWFRGVSSSSGSPAQMMANPLVVRIGGQSHSVLDLAEQWARSVVERTQSRFKVATGLDCELSCAPEDNFAWSWHQGSVQLSPDQLSTGLARWLSLAILETLREYTGRETQTGDFGGHDILKSIPEWAIPKGSVSVFSADQYWLAIDEPELHLYPTEERTLACALAAQAGKGQMILATHSLQLAAEFVGVADFLTFTEPGVFSVDEAPAVLRGSLRRLTADSPAILSSIEVLYVEGNWDEKILQLLWAEDLGRSRVMVEKLHGVKGAARVVGSMWTRMIGSKIWILFDSLRENQIGPEWRAMERSIENEGRNRTARGYRERAENQGQLEWKSFYEVLGTIADHGLEGQVTFLHHGLSDITQVLSPRRFGLDTDTWLAAGFDGSGSFHAWFKETTGRNHNTALGGAWGAIKSAAQGETSAVPIWDEDCLDALRRAVEPMFVGLEVEDSERSA